MPTLPDGDLAPPSGELPEEALTDLGGRGFGLYLHVPFCAVRCGYCDFNTYTLGELAAGDEAMAVYRRAALAEIDLAARVLGDGAPALGTVFVGGGTPTMLDPADLAALLDRVRERFAAGRRRRGDR